MISIRLDTADLSRLSNLIAAAGKDAGPAIARALNHTGAKGKTAVTRALTSQTGLKRKVIVKALKVQKASPGNLAFVMSTRGGDIALKYFGPRETRAGVSAAPWNSRRIFAGTFTKGGRFPNRVALNMGGHVMARQGGARLPIARQKSGLFIPIEMVQGQTLAAFDMIAERDLPGRVAHEILRLI